MHSTPLTSRKYGSPARSTPRANMTVASIRSSLSPTRLSDGLIAAQLRPAAPRERPPVPHLLVAPFGFRWPASHLTKCYEGSHGREAWQLAAFRLWLSPPSAQACRRNKRRVTSMNGADLLVAALENEGVTHFFGVPGEVNLDVVEALRRSKIELVLTRHEQAAAFMAATHGRLTGRPGVCLSTLRPGALNLSTGAAYAHLGAMPMILITGQKPNKSNRQARFQIVDVVATMKPLTKLSRQIISASSIPTVVVDAL